VRWVLLIHQLPPRPLYLRAKIRNRLARVGAVALKNSVYLLPARGDGLEDMEWIAQDAVAGGGEAFVCEAEFRAGATDDGLSELFRRDRDGDYRAFTEEAREALAALSDRSGRRPPEGRGELALQRLRRRLAELVEIDFFGAGGRKEAEAMLRELERKVNRGRPKAPEARGAVSAPRGATWATRRDLHVDRLASAWLIRRWIDPDARFRFVEATNRERRPGELRFDIVAGDFTHEGPRCTFETLLVRFALDDPALRALSEVVHDVDLKDGHFGRPEAPGLAQLVLGLARAHPDDDERMARAFPVFDALYASFGGRPPATPRTARRVGRRRAAPGRHR
jgi:hypothetical protein